MSIESYLSAIGSEVTNQADQLEIARTMLLNKATGGGGGNANVLIKEYTPTDYETDVTWHFKTDKIPCLVAMLCLEPIQFSEIPNDTRVVDSAVSFGEMTSPDGGKRVFGYAYGYYNVNGYGTTHPADAISFSWSGWNGNSQRGALNANLSGNDLAVSYVRGTTYPALMFPGKKYLIIVVTPN